MNFTNEALRILARQLGEESASSCAELEAKVTPLLRVIVQTGVGRPSLVQWVQHHLPQVAPVAHFGHKVDAKWAAPRLARLLCSQLLETIRVEGARTGACETLVA